MRALPTVTLFSPQTGDSGESAEGSVQDVTTIAANIGTAGCIAHNSGEIPNAKKAHYVHVTAEAIL